MRELAMAFVSSAVYFILVSAGVYVAFYVIAGKWLANRKIYKSPHTLREELSGLAWSLVHEATALLVSVGLTLALKRVTGSSVYRDVHKYGYAYLALSVVLAYLWNDLSFYFVHRALHTKYLYRYVHYVHHKYRNPTPWSRTSFHPLDTLAQGIFCFAPITLLIPIHPLALGIFGMLGLVVGVRNHLGYELFPARFATHPVFKYLTTGTHHQMHHARFKYNFSQLINWDLLFGTQDPQYFDKYAEVTEGVPIPRLRGAEAEQEAKSA